MNHFLRFWGPVCAYTALIFYMSSQSHPEEQVPLVTLFSDKVLHSVEYAVLGGLCYRAFHASDDVEVHRLRGFFQQTRHP